MNNSKDENTFKIQLDFSDEHAWNPYIHHIEKTVTRIQDSIKGFEYDCVILQAVYNSGEDGDNVKYFKPVFRFIHKPSKLVAFQSLLLTPEFMNDGLGIHQFISKKITKRFLVMQEQIERTLDEN